MPKTPSKTTPRKQKVNWTRLSADTQLIITAGAKDYHALKHDRPDYHHWVGVCKALQALRNEALRLSGLADHNGPQNPLKLPQYQAALGNLLEDPAAGDLKELTKDVKTASNCFWMADNLDAVNKWMEDERKSGVQILPNHPTVIWRKHPLGHAVKKAENAEKNLGKAQRGRKAIDAVDEVGIKSEEISDRLDTVVEKLTTVTSGYDLSEISSLDNFFDVHQSYGRDTLVAWFKQGLERAEAMSPEPPKPEPTAPAPAPQPATPKRGRGRKKADTAQPVPAPVTEPVPSHPSRRRGKGKAQEEPAPEVPDVIVKADPQSTVVADRKEPQYTKVQIDALRSQVASKWELNPTFKAKDYCDILGWGEVKNLDATHLRILVSVIRDKDPQGNASDIARTLGLRSDTVVQYWQ